MLKALIGLLVVANLAFFGWSSGVLDPWIASPSLRSDGDREPERLRRQVRPDTVKLLAADAADVAARGATTPAALASVASAAAASEAGLAAASSASSTSPTSPTPPASSASTASTASTSPAGPTASTSAPTACLEAGPFVGEAGAQAALAALRDIVGQDGLERIRTERAGRWAVYIGRYANLAARQRREDDLTRRGIAFERVDPPDALGPGLVLGRQADAPAADRALAELAARGVKTARVALLTPPTTVTILRVARADPATAARLAAVDPARLGGTGITACGNKP